MGQPAAKQGDQIVATDIHIVMVPAPSGPPIPTPLPHPFTGIIDGGLSPDVNIMGMPAATADSTANNTSPQSPTVNINGMAAARNGDMAKTCNDPADLPVGQVIAVGT